VTLRESGRNVLVELAEGSGGGAGSGVGSIGSMDERPPQQYPQPQPYAQPAQYAQPQPRREAGESQSESALAAGGAEPRAAAGIQEVRRLFQSAPNPPRWPMYIRQAKQFLRNVDASFDERKFGFSSLVDLLRACQRDGLFRIERDRQGVMRVFPGNVMQTSASGDEDARGNVAEAAAAVTETAAQEWTPADVSGETEVVEGDVVQEMNAPTPVLDGEAATTIQAEPEAGRKGRSRSGGRGRAKRHGETRPATDAKPAAEARHPRKVAEGVASKPRKPVAAKRRAPRPRAAKETPAV
jgi:hypothetical protein